MQNDMIGDDLGLLGLSDAMVGLRDTVRRVTKFPYPVLVSGESGSGKELVARAIHRVSRRSGLCFGAVNGASLTVKLVDTELFGHVSGAFTCAVTEHAGLFEASKWNTLLLDEVSELSGRAQSKLLRAFQNSEIRRIDENLPRWVDVRVVASTNRWFEADTSTGRFRTGLLYRLDVLRIVVLPLCERGDDVLVLVDHFWRLAQSLTGSRATPARSNVPRWPTTTGRAMFVNSKTSFSRWLCVAPGVCPWVRPRCLPAKREMQSGRCG